MNIALPKRLFVDRLIRNRKPALFAVRAEILHEVSNNSSRSPVANVPGTQARAGVVIRVLHQIDCVVPLLFVPLLVGQKVRTVAHDASALDGLARMTRRIQFVIVTSGSPFGRPAAHLLVRPVSSLFQSKSAVALPPEAMVIFCTSLSAKPFFVALTS